MNFTEHPVRGIAKNLLDSDISHEPLHLHITEVAPGQRSHPPHQHGGLEAFYVLEGEATLEIDGTEIVLRVNEAATFDPHKLHGIVNLSNAPTKYMVVLVRE